MPSPQNQSPGRRNLVQHLENHRKRHDLTWQEVADAGEIPLQTLRRVRVGTSPLSRETRERLEDLLRWELGSVQAVLDGGEPTPVQYARVERAALDTPVGQIVYHAVRAIEDGAEGLDSDERAELIQASEERLRSEITMFVEAKRAELERRRKKGT